MPDLRAKDSLHIFLPKDCVYIMINTLNYYNQNASSFIENTISVPFTDTQDAFLSCLSARALILDFGCGSGRDTKYFLEHGYPVEAVDGSAELCKYASAYTGIPVKQMLFQDLNETNRYDGIWACSSILHLPKLELLSVMGKMTAALKRNGVIYTSFKYGTFEGERNGRYFTDMTEETFAELKRSLPELTTEKTWITSDARPGRGNEKWLNLILRRN